VAYLIFCKNFFLKWVFGFWSYGEQIGNPNKKINFNFLKQKPEIQIKNMEIQTKFHTSLIGKSKQKSRKSKQKLFFCCF
jgi:hypothetical protein